MIFHVYSAYTPTNIDTIRRMRLARRTWDVQPWSDLPVKEERTRLFRDRAGRIPYIKDIIHLASKLKEDVDIIVLTNADICVAGNCCFAIVAALQSIDAAYCFRRDFVRLDVPLPLRTIKMGTHYAGSDLYAFRVGWWRTYQNHFPDMLLGRECWDAILRLLIDKTHSNKNTTLHDLIYHERHASVWENPANKRTLPSQMHNVSLAKSWMLANDFNPRIIGI
jgi:hypothetical protein